MGAIDLWRSLTRPAVEPRPTAVTGLPWQTPTSSLNAIVIDDVFGDMIDVVDRGNALRVGPVARGRALIVGSIADLPLIAYRGDEPLRTQPTWCYRSKYESPWQRMAKTIDDLIFNGASLWWRENGENGQLLDAWRVPTEAWSVDDQNRILVNDTEGVPQTVRPEDVIYIEGPDAGLIARAADTIRGARMTERAWVSRVTTPIPPTLFRQVEQDVVEPDEVKALTSAWAAARRNPDSAAVGFVPYGLEVVFPDSASDDQLFIEGRNAIRLDIANHLNVPASLLDGSTATASLTYVTHEGQRSSFHEQTMRYWTAPIEHRLSMDDVVPRGQRVRFDITYTTQEAPAGEPGED